MRRALAAVAVATLALTGCSTSAGPSAKDTAAKSTPGDSAGQSGSSSGSTTSGQSADAIEISIKGDDVEPMGKRVEVKAGEPVTLHVKSDRAAELHVHSSPEQELEVEPGESTLTVTIKTPGIVDVEEHHSETVVLQLEVR
jgi:phage-related baseplate assembly protein